MKVPLGIKVISRLYSISGVMLITFSLFFFIISGWMNKVVKDTRETLEEIPSVAFEQIKELDEMKEAVNTAPRISRTSAPFIILLAIVYIISGVNLRKLRNWARIAITVLSFLGLLQSLILISKGNYLGHIGLISNSIVLWYLLSNKNARVAFGRS